MESAHAIATGQLLSLSEQQLVDCSRSYGNYGCNGGLYDYAFNYAYYNALETEANYPYDARDEQCKYNKNYAKIFSRNYQNVRHNSNAAIKSYLAEGPVSVSVQANQAKFMNHGAGILTWNECSGTRLDHAITAVGWGNQAGTDYLIVRNSWGSIWGEGGYGKLEINDSYSACGVLMDPTQPYTN